MTVPSITSIIKRRDMKTYTFTTGSSHNLTIFLNVGKRRVKVQMFPPMHFGNMGEATYSTTDEALAEALKKHPAFGGNFFLKSEKEIAPKVKEVVAEKPEDFLDYTKDIIYEDSVNTKTKAVAYIQGMFDEAFSNTSSVDAMKKEAAKRWNVIFNAWK